MKSLTRRSFIQTGFSAGAGVCLPALIRNSTAPETRIRLITRGDDLGCAHSLNRAMQECFVSGILKNCSIIAPSPYVAEGAKLLAAEKDLCFGLHCALTSEWDNVRWAPVLPKEKVPSLVDGNGHLHQTSEAVWNNARADEALLELQAQLDRLRDLGFNIRYADMHMGTVARVPGLLDKWKAWCRAQHIIDTSAIGKPLPLKQNSWNNPDRRIQGDYAAQVIEAFASAEPGEYLIVGHPGYNDAETRYLGHPGYPGNAVAHNLNWQRQAFVDARVLKACLDYGVQPVRYDETDAGRTQIAATSSSVRMHSSGFASVF